MSLILLIILILLLFGSFPIVPQYGYAPSGLIGTLLVILIILMLLGRI